MEGKKLPDPRQNKMRDMPIAKLLFTMALPLVISMLVQAFYNIVDSIYVSRISDSAVTALSLAFPIQNLLIGFATGIAVGVNSLLSKSLGEGNQKRANQAAGNGIFLVSIVVLLFMVFGIFFAKPYYAMQSDVTETVEGGSAYTAICCIFAVGIFVEVLGERLLQASGRTIYTLITQGTGAILNIILDPLFIFGGFGIPAMGMAGAAVATVIGQWVAAILAVIINITCNHDVQFSLKAILPRKEVVGKILAVGIPSIIMMAIGSIMTFSMNQILYSFEDLGETAVGVFGIYFKLQSFVFMPVFGLNNASISIIAYNYGARQPHRITKTLKTSVCTVMIIMVAGLALFQFGTDLLLGIFNPTPAFLTLGRSALRIISIAFPMAAIGIALGASFQALGRGVYSTITSLSRQLIVLVPAAYLLSLSGNVNAVWWSFPVAEVVSLTVTLLLYSRLYKRIVRPMLGENQ